MKTAFELVTCTHCEQKVPTGVYCSNCGKQLFTIQGQVNITTSFCVNCGALTPATKYCSICGYEKDYDHYF
ncbi:MULTISPECIES: hypothetical protein [Loigolactobacillus]|uniref:Uncharacterized protein n=1 Tax=Loigolactobacillus backii TaxID=375175 RepID=A0A192GYJ0_9LACO|nr:MULTISPECIES: hypothetical protein [Loigolactobacillus]ANK60836.1 hypothetical protein AYR52_11595 [Loigolactobacillus backii]ANK61589.1 hypothetical protein AYR53_01710 [Loigolactobacillus backii]ANK65789.1 hypothetical protein AYR54_11390 [Loigolactobacillus backii]ANK68266.1 hypothetical protein AYR55_11540 [Loigolactobacillus backii]ANK69213.1 hypothetical protein AYR56_03005 [Loigolactobacillus backii]